MTSEKRQLKLDEIRGIEEWAVEELRGGGNEVLAYVDIESHPSSLWSEWTQTVS